MTTKTNPHHKGQVAEQNIRRPFPGKRHFRAGTRRSITGKGRFRTGTLKGRIAVAILSVGLLFLMLVTAMSYHVIHSLQESNLRSTLLFDLDQQANKLSENFTNMLLITQQLTPQGTVGKIVEEYLRAEEPFARAMLSRDVSTAMGQILFSHPAIELVMYWQPDQANAMFNNLPVRDIINLSSLPVLSATPDLTLHPPHISLCRVFRDQMISITREVTFLNGETWLIYIEARSDLYADVNLLSESTGMPYVLTLSDHDGHVRYTSNSGLFEVGQPLMLSPEGPLARQYRWNTIRSDYGFDTTLWIDTGSQSREVAYWRNLLFLLLLIVLPVALLIALLLMQLIYRPLHAFEKEMAEIGSGNLQHADYHWDIEEFDRLFAQFNEMKQRIQRLLLDVETKEKQKHKLEVDMLSYQINPHFLMNTLNSVHWLAQLHQQPEIDKVICTLNLLLAYNLGRSPEKPNLRSEIRVLKAYLELQQMRYDFVVTWDIEEGEYLDDPAAAFILQPIAENALTHGLDQDGTLAVSIHPDVDGQAIRIVIADDGKGMTAAQLDKVRAVLAADAYEAAQVAPGSIGLRYVRSVLETHYGGRAQIQVDSNPETGTAVTLVLPEYGGIQNDPRADR